MMKKEAIARKAAWQRALAEGRVVRHDDGMRLTSYVTAEAAQREVEVARSVGLKAEIVVVEKSS